MIKQTNKEWMVNNGWKDKCMDKEWLVNKGWNDKKLIKIGKQWMEWWIPWIKNDWWIKLLKKYFKIMGWKLTGF